MKWVSTFSYLPIPYNISLAKVKDQTQRVVFDNNLNGERIRLRFSNRYSKKTLVLQKVSIGVSRDGRIQDVNMISRNSNTIITLAPGEECWSDVLDFSVKLGEKIAVSIYVKEEQEIGSICVLWSRLGAVVTNSISEDFTNGEQFTDLPAEEIYPVVRDDVNKGMCFYGFSGLQVYTADCVKTVAAFGDSITHMSYVTNALMKRLYSAYPGQVALINRGIGGNRLLHDATYVESMPGKGCLFGEAGIRRFERDVFEEGNVDVVLVLEGINDIMHPIQFEHPEEMITPEDLEDGYKTMIEVARKHCAKIFGATITPCGHEDYTEDWLARFDAIRLPVNDRIRKGMGYDGYFDYEEAVRDEDHPGYMKAEYHIGDGLHPNDAGGAAMVSKVDLRKLME